MLTILYPSRAFSKEDGWAALEQWCIDHVPNALEDLWVRSGGKLSELEHGRSPAQSWRSALRKMRLGAVVRPEQILEVLREDYPHSDELRALDGLFKR